MREAMNCNDVGFPAGTRFLVTGGAGFIGANLAEILLSLDYEVRVLDDLSNGRAENIEELRSWKGFEFIKGSICDYETCAKACEGMDYVLHQAAWGSVPRSVGMPLEYDTINVHGTLNMMQAALKAGVKKFVYASSSSVYGDHPGLPKVEGTEGRPLSPYAVTKRVNEYYARLYYDVYRLKTVGLRYFNVFGRRQNPNSAYAAVIPAFVKALMENRAPVIYGDGSQSRDFTNIENVIEANLKSCLAGDEANGEVFNIAYGSSVTINELYGEISRILGKNIDPVYEKARAGDVRHSLADISKARQMLGYDPKYDLKTGLELTIDWYRKKAAL